MNCRENEYILTLTLSGRVGRFRDNNFNISGNSMSDYTANIPSNRSERESHHSLPLSDIGRNEPSRPDHTWVNLFTFEAVPYHPYTYVCQSPLTTEANKT